MTFNTIINGRIGKYIKNAFQKHIICWGSKKWFSKPFLAQVRARWAESGSKSKKCSKMLEGVGGSMLVLDINKINKKKIGWGWTASASNPSSPDLGRFLWVYFYCLMPCSPLLSSLFCSLCNKMENLSWSAFSYFFNNLIWYSCTYPELM